MADPIIAEFERRLKESETSPIVPDGTPPTVDPIVAEFERRAEAAGLPPAPGIAPDDVSLLGAAGIGLESGLHQVGSAGIALGALGADIFGAEETQADLTRRLVERQLQAEREFAAPVGFDEAFESPGNFATWLAFSLGEQAPNIATIIAGGGAGGLLGKAVMQGAITKATAQMAGSYIAASGLETGSTVQEQIAATGEINPAIAVSAGMLKGATELITPLAIGQASRVLGIEGDVFRRLILGAVDDPRVLSRMATTAAKTGLIESATEGFQEAIDVAARQAVDETYPDTPDEIKNRIIESAVTAFFVGGGFGGFTGAIAPREGLTSPQDVRPGRVVDEDVAAVIQPETPGTPAAALPAPTDQDSPPSIFDTFGSIEAIPTPLVGETLEQRIEQDTEIEPFITSVEKKRIAESPEFLEFESPDRAAFASALVASDPREQVFLRARTPLREQQDVSALVYNLPETIDQTDPNVTLKSDETSADALNLAQQASFLIRRGRFQAARSKYKEALKKGFRYKPDELQGFVSMSGISAEGVLPVGAPAFPIPEGSPVVGGDQGRTVRTPGQEDIHVIGPAAAPYLPAQADLKSKEQPAYVDLGAVPTDQMSLGNIQEIFPRIKETTPAQEAFEQVEQRIAAKEVRLLKPETYGPQELATDLINYAGGTYSEREQLLTKMLREGARFYVRGMGPKDIVIVGDIPRQAKVPLAKFPERTFDRYPRTSVHDLDVFISLAMGKKVGEQTVSRRGNAQKLDELAADIQPGQVKTLFKDTAAYKDAVQYAPKNLRRLEKLAQELVTKFSPDSRLVMFFEPTEINRNGWIYSNHENFHIIKVFLPSDHVTVGNPESISSMLDTMAHEFGHLLSSRYLMDPTFTSDGVRNEILSAYNRALYRAAFKSSREGTGEFFSLSQISLDSGNLLEALPGKERFMNKIAHILPGGQRAEYWFSFEEWIAQQMSEWITGKERPPMGKAESLIKWLSRKVEEIFEYVHEFIGSERKSFNASSAFEAFMEYIQQKNPEDFNLHGALLRYRDSRRVWVEELGAFVSPQTTSNLMTNLTNSTTVQNAIKQTNAPETVQKELNIYGLANDYFNSVVKHGWTVLQLAWKNQHIDWLQRYVDTAEQWYNEKTQWLSRANRTIRDWGSLSKEDSDKLSAFIFEVDQMTYLSKEERQKGQWRQPNREELQALINKYGLNQGTYKMFLQIRNDLVSMLDRMESIVKDNMRRNLDPGSPTLLLELARVEQEFARMRARPYFPHARFGDWSIVVKDKNGKTAFMTQVEVPAVSGAATSLRGTTPRAVIQEQQRVKALYKESEGYTVGIDRMPEQAKIFRGLPPSLLKSIRDNLGKDLSVDQQIWLDRLMVEMAPGQSFRKRLAKRENIPGYTQDAMRAYADYFWHGANHIARISYGHEMQKVINDGEKDTATLRNKGFNVGKRRQMLDFLQDHIESILNPQPDWAQARSFAFTWWLGFSPASAVLNFTQIPIATAPYLTERFGTVSGLGALRKAIFNVRKMYSDPEALRDKDLISEADYRLLEVAFRQGFIEESLAMELAGVAEGSNLVRIRHGTKAQRAMTSFAHAAGWLFQGSEKINRRVTFSAAVELARKDPDNQYLKDLRATMKDEFFNLTAVEGLNEVEAQAFLAGKDAVRRTQFEYARWARPRFMRGRKGVIFTFYMFTQNMVWSVLNNPGNTRMLLVMFAMGGLMGLPGAEDMEKIASYIGKKIFGRHFDLEQEIAQVLGEITGSNRAADLVLHGAAREGFGLAAAGDMTGIPFPKFDMSGSVGLGRVVPGIQEAFGSGSFDERFARTTTDIAGASIGIGINMLKFLTDTSLPIDDMKRWERAMPRALKNVVRGMRYTPPDASLALVTGNFVSPEGRERTRQGDTVIPFDSDNPEHMMEIALQMAGFNPTRLTREWNERIASIEVINYWKTRRQMLYAHYWHTLYTGDKEARRDVIDGIKKFNSVAPFPEMRITRKQLSESIKRRKKIMQQRERGIEPTKMYRRLQRQVRETYSIPDDGITEEPLPRP